MTRKSLFTRYFNVVDVVIYVGLVRLKRADKALPTKVGGWQKDFFVLYNV